MFNFLHNLRIGPKIFISYSILLVMMLAFPVGTFLVMGSLQNQTRQVVMDDTVTVAYSLKLQMASTQHLLADQALTRNAAAKGRVDDAKKRFVETLSGLKTEYATHQDKETLATLEQIAQAHEAFYQAGLQMTQAYLAGKLGEGAGLNANLERAAILLDQLLEELLAKARRHQTGEVNAIMANMQATGYQVLVGALVALVVGVVLSAFIIRDLTRSLGQLVRQLGDLNRGNITNRLRWKRLDEIGQVARALDAFADNLQHEIMESFNKLAQGDLTFEARGLIREGLLNTNTSLSNIMLDLRGVAEKITGDSMNIYGLSQGISSGAATQDSSLKDINTTMGDLTGKIEKNARTAQKASNLAQDALEEAQRGNNRMTEMVMAMNAITESANDIFSVIKVIDDIAFQTNLLALNAAVESGRAGQHGKGFAVVADEVRQLAQKSADAAHETQELIEKSMERVQNGSEIARNMALVLNQMVEQISEASNIMSEIAEDAMEQANNISNVTSALSNIEKVTHTNTQNANEWITAFGNIAAQLSVMGEKLDKFRLKMESKPLMAGNSATQGQVMTPGTQVPVDDKKYKEY